MSDAESTHTNNFYLTGEMIMHVLIVQTVLGGLITVTAVPAVVVGVAVVAAAIVIQSCFLIFRWSHSAYTIVIAKNGTLLWNAQWHSDKKLPLYLSLCVNCVLKKVYLFNFIYIYIYI